jgi:glucosamine--fructose-6-phosphate aminotransferase (isomerizing)
MCGIIGIIARETVTSGLLEGLRRLEYRGYASAGIATLVDGQIECRRAEGNWAVVTSCTVKIFRSPSKVP